MPIRDCLGQVSERDLPLQQREQFIAKADELMAKGMSEEQAAAEIINEFHKQIYDELSTLKKSIGIKAEPYNQIASPEKLKEINDEYETIISNKKTELENAIPKRSTETLPMGERAENSGALGEGISQPKEPAGTQEEGKGTGEKEKVSGVYAEYPETRITYRGLQETATEFGLEDITKRERKSDIKLRKEAEDLILSGFDIDALVEKILTRKVKTISDAEKVVLGQRLANLKQQARGIKNKLSPEYDKVFKEIERYKNAGKIIQGELGAALRDPTFGAKADDSLESFLIQKKEANDGADLTDMQKEKTIKLHEEYEAKLQKEEALRLEAERKYNDLLAQKELNKAKSKSGSSGKKKTKEDFISERAKFKDELKAAKEEHEKWLKENNIQQAGISGIVLTPKMVKAISKIVGSHVEEIGSNLAEVAKRVLNEVKDIFDGITEEDIRNVIAGVYNEKRPTLTKYQADLADIKEQARLINKYETLINGVEHKNEISKRKRNEEINKLRQQIKDFKTEEAEANKFYGESDAAERKLNKLRDELERIQQRRKKEAPKKDSPEEKEISDREKALRSDIEKAQAVWDKEKAAAREAEIAYRKLETERNRQLDVIETLTTKIEQLESGVKSVTKREIKKDTPEIEALKQQKKEAEKKFNETVATEKRIRDKEEELQRLKDRKYKEPSEKEKKDISDREKELNAQIKEERKAFGSYERENLTENYAERLVKRLKEKNQAQTKKIEQKIANKDYDKEEKTSFIDNHEFKNKYPELYKKVLNSIAAREDAKHKLALDIYLDQQAKRTTGQKAVDLVSSLIATSKAIVSGIDDSFVLMQNYYAMLANPKIGAQSFKEHALDAFSEKRFNRQLAALHESKMWDVIQKSGLDVLEPKSLGEGKIEEAFDNNLLNKTIRLKNGKELDLKKINFLRPFERMFTSMGNNMRVKLFLERAQTLIDNGKTFESNPQEYKDAARIINEITGRGKQNKYVEMANPLVTPFIWSPRLISSGLNMLGISDLVGALGGKNIGTEGFYRKMTPAQRKYAFSQIGRGIATGISIMGLFALTGKQGFGWTDNEVDFDPRSVTFGTVKIGNKQINVFGRLAPYVKAIVQSSTGTRVKQGEEQDINSGRNPKTVGGVLGGLLRSKVTPFTGYMYDKFLNAGRDYYTGEKLEWSDAPRELGVPIGLQEIGKNIERDGSLAALQFFGSFFGLQISDKRDFQKENELVDWNTIYEKNANSKENNTGADVIIHDPKTRVERKMNMEELTKFQTERDKYIRDEIDKIKKNGIGVWDDKKQEVVTVSFDKITNEQLKEPLRNIKSDASEKTRERLFPETDNEKRAKAKKKVRMEQYKKTQTH